MAVHQSRVGTAQIRDRANWGEWMGQALQHMGSSRMLEDNPLARHPYIDNLSRRKYGRRHAPFGSAL